MARRTKDEAEKTRAAILKVAEVKFYGHGVVSTSLQEIAKEAGVTRGAVYWHFKDKADVLRSLADEAFLPHEALLDRLVSEDSLEPLATLCEHCVATLNALTNDPHRRRLLTILTRRCEYIEDIEGLAHRNAVGRERVKERLTAIFEKAMNKGKLAAFWTPETATQALHNMIVGFIHNEMEWKRPSRSRDAVRNETLRAFFKALSAP